MNIRTSATTCRRPTPHQVVRLRVPLCALHRAVLLTLLGGAPLAASAQSGSEAVATLPRVEVTQTAQPPLTRVTEDIAASPASVTVLGRKELDQKSINTYGDIFRGVTGAYVNEYGQGLVAYEIKFRGFSSGHGRDVATYLDGVPLNITGSQHTNGYADLAQLIPELIDRVEIVRGPFSVYAGNHAVAGSVQLFTDRSVKSSFKATVDSNGRTRVLPIYSTPLGSGNFVAALDATKGSGYTHQSDVKRLNFLTRYSFPLGSGQLGLRFQAYYADAEAPGYLDLARIRSGELNRRDALTRGIGDTKRQQNVTLNYRSDDPEGSSGFDSGWSASLYAVRDRRQRFTNFDISLPPDSDSNLGGERDRLQQSGLDVRKVTSFSVASMPSQLAVGLQYNREKVAALHFTAGPDQHRIEPSLATPDTTDIDREVLTTTKSIYAQLQVQPIAILKLTAGLRYDDLEFDVDLHARDDTFAAAVSSGLGSKVQSSDSRTSPKVGAALQVLDTGAQTVTLYANYALGLKSPYAFSDFYSNLATSSVVPDLSVSTLRSYEVGLQGGSKDGGFQWRAGVWDTTQKNEGQRNDVGVFEDFGKTDRRGFDLEGSVMVTSTTRLYGHYSEVHARSRSAAAGQDHLSNVPEWIGGLGVQSVLLNGPHRIELSLEDSLIGPQPLNGDNSLRGRHYNRVTARAAYSNPAFKGATGFVSLIGYDRRYEETRFDFGGGAIGVSPRQRLQATVGIQVPFNL